MFTKFLKAQPSAPAAKPQPITATPVPPNLPKISTPTAAELAGQSNPSPEARALIEPGQTPAQHLAAMQKEQMGDDMIKTIAHGLPDREGVHWAAQSAEKVADKLPAEDVQATKAAQTWVKSPSAQNKAAAGAAAARTNYRGPGALAAQGAAWSQPGGATAGGPRMTPHAVSSSVQLSSAIQANPKLATPTTSAPAVTPPVAKEPSRPSLSAPPPQQLPATQTPPTVPPAIQAQKFQQQQPFIQMGLDIASGKTKVG